MLQLIPINSLPLTHPEGKRYCAMACDVHWICCVTGREPLVHIHSQTHAYVRAQPVQRCYVALCYDAYAGCFWAMDNKSATLCQLQVGSLHEMASFRLKGLTLPSHGQPLSLGADCHQIVLATTQHTYVLGKDGQLMDESSAGAPEYNCGVTLLEGHLIKACGYFGCELSVFKLLCHGQVAYSGCLPMGHQVLALSAIPTSAHHYLLALTNAPGGTNYLVKYLACPAESLYCDSHCLV